jgi:hypothetical protein
MRNLLIAAAIALAVASPARACDYTNGVCQQLQEQNDILMDMQRTQEQALREQHDRQVTEDLENTVRQMAPAGCWLPASICPHNN